MPSMAFSPSLDIRSASRPAAIVSDALTTPVHLPPAGAQAEQRCSLRKRNVKSPLGDERPSVTARPGDQPPAPSRRRPSAAYSASRSLTDRPRRSALAASRSASAVGMTTVRRTQSSLSHPSPGMSDMFPPLRRDAGPLLQRDIAAQDAVAQQAKAAQVGEAGPLSEPGDQRQVQRRAEASDRKVELDPAFELGSSEPGVEPAAGLAAKQPLEPAGLEADRDDNEVIGNPLALAAVLDRDHNLPLPGFDPHCPPGQRAKAARLIEHRLGLQREDAPVGALEELAPVRLSQAWPVTRIGVEAVLVVALPARIEDSAAGQDVDRRAPGRFLQQADDHRGCRLAAADHARTTGNLLAERSLGQPVAAPVVHARVLLRLAGDGDRRARAGEDDAVSPDRLPRLERQPPLLAVGLQADDLTGDDLGFRPVGDFTQVGTPLPMRRAQPAAIDPVGIHATRDQMPLPRSEEHTSELQ